MKYAIVENNVVVNVAESEQPLDLTWVQSDVAKIGDIYDGTSFTTPLPDKDWAEEYYRLERNRRLEETDWWANTDVIMSDEQRQYRQALRDITDHANWPYLQDADWPNLP